MEIQLEKGNSTTVARLEWEEKKPDGLHGIVTNPLEQKGCLSKWKGVTSWYPLGEGQDGGELVEQANIIHKSRVTPGSVTQEELRQAGQRLRELAKPKVEAWSLTWQNNWRGVKLKQYATQGNSQLESYSKRFDVDSPTTKFGRWFLE